VVAGGRLSQQKNFATLVAAAGRMEPDLRDRCRILIAGEGELRPDLEALIARLGLQEVVLMPGNLPDLQEIFGSADLFVLPSLWEGLPLILLEALAAGLPVVGSRIPGIEEVVGSGEVGLLCQPGSAEDLARALSALLRDAERRSAMAERARDLALSEYSFAETVARHEELYYGILGNKGAPRRL
jgi:glycosyltransferase involved in cell wall biosynthesis